MCSLLGGSCPYQELADQPTGKEASVTHIAFSLDAQYVILCKGSQALVYSTKVGLYVIHDCYADIVSPCRLMS